MENGTAVKNWNAKSLLLAATFTRDNRLATCGRDQRTRIWAQDGKQLLETKPIGEVAVSVAYADESRRVITGNWSGTVQVYNDDKGAVQGALVTNPPTLDARLAAAKKTLQQKTVATSQFVSAEHKAEAAAAAAQKSFTEAQQKLAAHKSDADKLAAEVKQLTAARAATDAERSKAAASVQQIESARPSVAEALRHLTEALGKLPNDAKLVAAQRALNEQLKALETSSAALQAKANDLTGALTTADAKLKETNAHLEAVNKDRAAAAEKLKPLEAQSQKLAAALDAARKAATPAEKELADANRAVARWQNEIAFRDQIAALQKELEAVHTLAAARQAELDKANKQLAAVQTTVNGAKSKLDEASKGIDMVNAKIQAARAPAK
jgi:chromosome segregation ATPase